VTAALRWLRAQVTRRPRHIRGRLYLWTRDQYERHDRRFGSEVAP
jgi:hypothetical protein